MKYQKNLDWVKASPVRPYAALGLEYGRVSKIREKSWWNEIKKLKT